MARTENGTRSLVLEIGGERIGIRLLWEEAPQICSTLWARLPLEGSGHLAKLCNNELMIMLPFAMARENLQAVTPGKVGWWDVRSCINIWFDDPGPNGPLGLTALFGEIQENIEGLKKLRARMWSRPGTPLRLSREAD